MDGLRPEPCPLATELNLLGLSAEASVDHDGSDDAFNVPGDVRRAGHFAEAASRDRTKRRRAGLRQASLVAHPALQVNVEAEADLVHSGDAAGDEVGVERISAKVLGGTGA